MISDTGPFAIVPEWLIDAKISDRALRLYCILARYADANGDAFPARSTLAERMRCAERTVDAALAALIEAGALTVEPRQRANGSQTSNRYRLRRVQVARGGSSQLPPQNESHSNEIQQPLPIENGSSGGSDRLDQSERTSRMAPAAPSAEMFFADHVRAFLTAPTKQKAVAAFVDLERFLGHPAPEGGRVAALVNKFGHGMEMVSALVSSELAVGNRYDLMQKGLGNAASRRRTGGRPGQRAVAGRAEDIQRDF